MLQVTREQPPDAYLHDLLLDAPQLMGVESMEIDNVNVRMVARTLPAKQFEVGRRLRVLVIAGTGANRHSHRGDSTPFVEAIVHPATTSGAEGTQGPVSQK